MESKNTTNTLPIDHPLVPLGRAPFSRPTLRVAVDLSIMRPSGENGGIKVFVYEYLKRIIALHGEEVTFVYLAWAKTLDDVRSLARTNDEIICVRLDDDGKLPQNINWRNNEVLWLKPPADFLHRLRIDVLYLPQPYFEFATPGIPLIATIVDILHKDYPASLDHVQIQMREKIHLQLAQCANYFQCISNHVADRLRVHYSIDPERIFRTYIPVGQRLDANATSQASQAFLSLPKSYFLYPANAWKHKNHRTLLVAFSLYKSRAKTQGGGWDLVLTGHDDAPMREILKDAQALGVENSVHYFGHLSSEKFAQVWKQASGLVFPSLHEGFGIPLIEAMHFGIPILASNEGSLPEVAGNAALFADCRKPEALADALLQMSASQSLREQLTSQGRIRAKQFSLDAETRVFFETIKAASKERSPQWAKGFYSDGWTGPLAVVSLPHGAAQLSLSFAPMPVSRHVRLYIDGHPRGGFVVPAAQKRDMTLRYMQGARYLSIETVDASNLSPTDHRTHGVIISALQLIATDGKTHNLLINSL